MPARWQPWGDDPDVSSSLRILAQKHGLTTGFIVRGMEASIRAGISPRYFLERYLHSGTVPLNADFEKHYLDIIREQSPG